MNKSDFEDIAIATKKWMKKIGARHDYDKKRRSYMTRDEWADKMKLIGFDIEPKNWPRVANTMFENKIWIGLAPGKGWYLCKHDDAASSLIIILNTAISMYRTAIARMTAMESSGDFAKIAEGLPGRIPIGDFRDIPVACKAFGIDIGESVVIAMEDTQRLLTDSIEAFSEASR